MVHLNSVLIVAFISITASSCNKTETTIPETDWNRHPVPVLRDLIPGENYQSASDGQVFFDSEGELKMIYSGDVDGISSIKLASGNSWIDWTTEGGLLTAPGPSGNAISKDDGETWNEFQEVDSSIGMEGQVTLWPDGKYYAFRTDQFEDIEAIYYPTAEHPFGPWENNATPIITRSGSEYEKQEVIAPQITFDLATGKKMLFYTRADHAKGWWMLLATEPD